MAKEFSTDSIRLDCPEHQTLISDDNCAMLAIFALISDRLSKVYGRQNHGFISPYKVQVSYKSI